MASKVKPVGKLFIILLVVAIVTGGAYYTGILDTITGGDVVRIAKPTYPGITGLDRSNGGLEPNAESRFTKDYGINVQVSIVDNLMAQRDLLLNDQIDVGLTTLDGLVPGIDELSKFGIEVFGMTDKSQGADVAVAIAKIQSLDDLKSFPRLYGRKARVGYQEPGPSMFAWGMLIEGSDLEWNDVEHVSFNEVPEVVDALISGAIDVGMVWAPDDLTVYEKAKGTHSLWSTKQGSELLFGIMYAKKEWIAAHPKEVKALTEGWMVGNAELMSSASARKETAKLLENEYGGKIPAGFWEDSYANVRCATYGDAVNFFGLNPSYTGMTANRIYAKAVKFYQERGLLGTKVPSWREISNTSVISSISLSGSLHEAQKNEEFTPVTAKVAALKPVSTKTVRVNFASNSAKLDANAKAELDGYADILKMNRTARFRIDGHTDADGNRLYNITLSEERGWAMANYFIDEYGFKKNQFIVVGHGPDQPIADNSTEAGKWQNRRAKIGIVIE